MFGGVVHGKPILPATLVELPRKVRTGDRTATLGCTLLVPAPTPTSCRIGKGQRAGAQQSGSRRVRARPQLRARSTAALPAVVLLGGFGAQDREGNSVGPGDFHLSFFSTLALTLGEAGVASLRCDDRGTGQSTGDRKAARLETLPGGRPGRASRPGGRARDRSRAARSHRSLGGCARRVHAGQAQQPGAGAGAAGPAGAAGGHDRPRTGGGQHETVRPDRSRDRGRDDRAAGTTTYAVRAGTAPPAWLTQSERRAFVESSPWLRSLFRHRSARGCSAAALRGGGVHRHGAKDVQITVKDAELTRDAFVKAGNRSVTTKIYPALNHLFAASKNDSLADYYDPHAQIDAGFLQDVAAFLSKSLARSNVASR